METSIFWLGGFTAASVIVLFFLKNKWLNRLDSMLLGNRLTRILSVAYFCLSCLLFLFPSLMFLAYWRLQTTGLDQLAKILLTTSSITLAAICPLACAILVPLSVRVKNDAKSFYRQLAIIEVFLAAPFAIGLIGLSIWYFFS